MLCFLQINFNCHENVFWHLNKTICIQRAQQRSTLLAVPSLTPHHILTLPCTTLTTLPTGHEGGTRLFCKTPQQPSWVTSLYLPLSYTANFNILVAIEKRFHIDAFGLRMFEGTQSVCCLHSSEALLQQLLGFMWTRNITRYCFTVHIIKCVPPLLQWRIYLNVILKLMKQRQN